MTSAGSGISSELKMRILRKIDSLSNAERKVANVALQCGDKLLDYTIARLAQESGVSEPTVLRFCYNLDFRGFKEMKKASVSMLTLPANPPVEDVSLDEVDEDEKLIAFVLNNMDRVLKETHTLLDRGEMVRAIRILERSRYVRVVGLGGSSVVARHVQHYLRKAGLHVALLSAYDLDDAKLEQYGEDDVLFAISHSGNNAPILDIASDAKRKGASVISITAWGENKLARMSDASLQAPYPGRALIGGIYYAIERVAQIAVVNLLFTAIYAKRHRGSDSESREASTN